MRLFVHQEGYRVEEPQSDQQQPMNHTSHRASSHHASLDTSFSDEPLTDQLLAELLSSPSPTAFTDAHHITRRSAADYLNYLLEKKGLKRAAVIKAAGLNETFGYQIFKGERQGSRNKMLQLAFAMGLSLQETNRLLQAAHTNELYPKDRRDAIIIFCLDKGYSLAEVECELYRFKEETIC